MNIQEAYVSFKTAKLLKEKGFNAGCNSYFISDNEIALIPNRRDFNNHGVYLSAPTHQMAMAWLREIHNIHIELNPICYGDTEEDLKWHYGWAVKTTIFTDRWKRHNAEHISYEQACEAALKYCLENLI